MIQFEKFLVSWKSSTKASTFLIANRRTTFPSRNRQNGCLFLPGPFPVKTSVKGRFVLPSCLKHSAFGEPILLTGSWEGGTL